MSIKLQIGNWILEMNHKNIFLNTLFGWKMFTNTKLLLELQP